MNETQIRNILGKLRDIQVALELNLTSSEFDNPPPMQCSHKWENPDVNIQNDIAMVMQSLPTPQATAKTTPWSLRKIRKWVRATLAAKPLRSIEYNSLAKAQGISVYSLHAADQKIVRKYKAADKSNAVGYCWFTALRTHKGVN